MNNLTCTDSLYPYQSSISSVSWRSQASMFHTKLIRILRSTAFQDRLNTYIEKGGPVSFLLSQLFYSLTGLNGQIGLIENSMLNQTILVLPCKRPQKTVHSKPAQLAIQSLPRSVRQILERFFFKPRMSRQSNRVPLLHTVVHTQQHLVSQAGVLETCFV